jgi:hypothetical protein
MGLGRRVQAGDAMITKCIAGCTLFFWLPLVLTIKAVIG